MSHFVTGPEFTRPFVNLPAKWFVEGVLLRVSSAPAGHTILVLDLYFMSYRPMDRLHKYIFKRLQLRTLSSCREPCALQLLAIHHCTWVPAVIMHMLTVQIMHVKSTSDTSNSTAKLKVAPQVHDSMKVQSWGIWAVCSAEPLRPDRSTLRQGLSCVGGDSLYSLQFCLVTMSL